VKLPTLIVREARRGKWTISLAGYGEVEVCHAMFLNGSRYRQELRGAKPQTKERKRAQAQRIAKDGAVVISEDRWTDLGNNKVDRHRTGYVGLFAAGNVNFDGKALIFDVGERLANLRRPR
jgi:hypothetical protein